VPTFTCDPTIELTGFTVLSLTENLTSDDIYPILVKHNLTEIDPDAWYPLQAVLNVLRDVYESEDGMLNLVSIGMGAARQSLQHLPPEAQTMSVAEFLKAYENIYQQRHRHGIQGEIQSRQVDDGHLEVALVDVPYPDDLMYGLFYEFTRHFTPQGMGFTLQYDPRARREELGGDTTIIHINVLPA